MTNANKMKHLSVIYEEDMAAQSNPSSQTFNDDLDTAARSRTEESNFIKNSLSHSHKLLTTKSREFGAQILRQSSKESEKLVESYEDMTQLEVKPVRFSGGNEE